MTIHIPCSRTVECTKSEKINFGFILNNVLCYLERLPNKAVDITLEHFRR